MYVIPLLGQSTGITTLKKVLYRTLGPLAANAFDVAIHALDSCAFLVQVLGIAIAANEITKNQKQQQQKIRLRRSQNPAQRSPTHFMDAVVDQEAHLSIPKYLRAWWREITQFPKSQESVHCV